MKRFRANSYNFWGILLLLSKANMRACKPASPHKHWRRCRDLNPSAGKTDLPDFESGPFNHLGTSPGMFELRFDGEKTEQIIKFC